MTGRQPRHTTAASTTLPTIQTNSRKGFQPSHGCVVASRGGFFRARRDQMTPDEWNDTLAEAAALREMAGMEPLPRLSCSFSGGRTSAVMTKRLWKERRDSHELRITFCNTSCEDDRTLDFVHQCETHWGWPVVWLEAVVDPRPGKGIKHRIVSYETACRDGEVFEAVVQKYGITASSTRPKRAARRD